MGLFTTWSHLVENLTLFKFNGVAKSGNAGFEWQTVNDEKQGEAWL